MISSKIVTFIMIKRVMLLLKKK